METKHKNCFCNTTIRHHKCQRFYIQNTTISCGRLYTQGEQSHTCKYRTKIFYSSKNEHFHIQKTIQFLPSQIQTNNWHTKISNNGGYTVNTTFPRSPFIEHSNLKLHVQDHLYSRKSVTNYQCKVTMCCCVGSFCEHCVIYINIWNVSVREKVHFMVSRSLWWVCTWVGQCDHYVRASERWVCRDSV